MNAVSLGPLRKLCSYHEKWNIWSKYSRRFRRNCRWLVWNQLNQGNGVESSFGTSLTVWRRNFSAVTAFFVQNLNKIKSEFFNLKFIYFGWITGVADGINDGQSARYWAGTYFRDWTYVIITQNTFALNSSKLSHL
jgi:hypothetical protein